MKPEKVHLYIKPDCGWCDEAMTWLDERGILYETRDVIADAAAFKQMIALSGQTMAPVIEVSGAVLADFGAEELAEWWVEQGFDTGKR